MSTAYLQLITPDWPAPPGVRAAFTLRTGGVSVAPYDSLNLGAGIGDSPEAVAENRRRVRERLRLPAEPVWLDQVHGFGVVELGARVAGTDDGAAYRVASGASAFGRRGGPASPTAGVEAAYPVDSAFGGAIEASGVGRTAGAGGGTPGVGGRTSGVGAGTPGVGAGTPGVGGRTHGLGARTHGLGGAAASGADDGQREDVLGGGAALALRGDLPGVPPTADAAITRHAGCVCAIRVADCMPVLVAAQDGSAVGAAHAGWRGLAGGVLEATVRELGVPAPKLMAWMGPAIGPRHFEVGDDVRAAFVSTDAESASAFAPNARGRWQCDLYALARRRLNALGVSAIYGGGWCTFAEADRFFSYRRERQSGRMAALIWIDRGQS